MNGYEEHRLDGLEPDNLLAFIALLGLLRVLEEVRPEWRPRVSWAVDEPPLRPILRVPDAVDKVRVVEAAAEGIGDLARRHDFHGMKNLQLAPGETGRYLRSAVRAADRDRYVADLWAALVSDVAITRDRRKVEATPLCLLFGQGHQYFLERLASVPRKKIPPARRVESQKVAISEAECLSEALFAPWRRLDATPSFRWDPHEDVRYALRARAPSDDKEATQHGANRLAAIGFSTLTVVPRRRAGQVKLVVLGGSREAGGGFVFRWPIWSEFVSLAGIRCLLGHPRLDALNGLAAQGVVEVRRARQLRVRKYMSFTRAEPPFEQ